MRELLGDLLMVQNQPGAALLDYEQSMLATPERLRGYYGAARAADACGDKAKAAHYFRKLLKLTRGSDSDRTELKEATQYLAAVKQR